MSIRTVETGLLSLLLIYTIKRNKIIKTYSEKLIKFGNVEPEKNNVR